MKRLISTIISVVILICFSLPVGAYDYYSDVNKSFLLPSDGLLYLTKETKAGEISFFQERLTIKSQDGTILSADDYIKTGDTLCYLNLMESEIIVLGDVNWDGRVTAADARLVLQASAGLHLNLPFDIRPDFKGAFDADCSGSLTASDSRAILRVAAKLDDFSEFEEIIAKRHTDSEHIGIGHESIIIYLNPDYATNKDAYKPEFYGDLVERAELHEESSADHIWIELYLKVPSEKNIYALLDECYNNDAVIFSLIYYIFEVK